MRLKYQLFLMLLAASAVLIASMYFISSWNFSRGFLSYVNQSALERVEPLSESLLEQYEENGNWEWLNKDSFHNTVVSTFRLRARNNRNAPAERERKEASKSGDKQGRAGRKSGNFANLPRVVVTDENKKKLFGQAPPNAQMHWKPLELNDSVVGYIGIARIERIDRQFDRAFEQQQRKTLGLTALAMIALSALLSIPLAARVVRPLLNVNDAVDEISGGNYAHRVGIKRRDEIGELAGNIDTLGRTLEQNRHARQRWIAEISHELRTPLAVLRGEVEALQDGVRQPDKPTLDSLHNEVLNLSRLIDDLHTLSMSDIGALDYQMLSLNFSDLVEQHVQSHKSQIEAHELSLDMVMNTPNAPINGDRQRLEQLLSNLLQNSLRYTNAGGKLLVSLTQSSNEPNTNSSKHPNNIIRLDWMDSGPGVEPDALEQLFEPLYRAEQSRNRQSGGAGLGLSICKRIVEAHNGTIKAKASPLGGVHIQIDIPLSGAS